MLRYILFDLDNTIYPQDSGLWEAIGERIDRYMTERLGYHPDDVHERRDTYHRAFGTTLNALSHYYGIDADDFLEYVHDIPLEDHIHPAPELNRVLAGIPLRKVIFTNADAAHAERVLKRLGIEHHFERIIDILSLEFVNKPDIRSYQRAAELLGTKPEECILVEDSLANLAPARELGMVTVFVGPAEQSDGADYRIANLLELEDCVLQIIGNR